MDDQISRKAVLDFMKGWKGKGCKGETIEYVRNLPSVPVVPLDKLCVLLKELNESGYSFQCAFCKKAFPAWCDEKNTDIGWDRELQCPTWEEITEWMVKLDDHNGTD